MLFAVIEQEVDDILRRLQSERVVWEAFVVAMYSGSWSVGVHRVHHVIQPLLANSTKKAEHLLADWPGLVAIGCVTPLPGLCNIPSAS